MKTHYLYSIPCFALTCALAGCSDDDKNSSGKPDQEAAALTPASAVNDPGKPVSSDLVAKRAERLGVAALFPADISLMGGVYDIPGMIKGFQNLNMYKAWGISEIDVEEDDESIAIPGEGGASVVVKEDVSEITVTEIDSPVIDAMIGFGPGWAGWLTSAQDAFGNMGHAQLQSILETYSAMCALKGGTSEDTSSAISAMMNKTFKTAAEWAALVDLRPSQDKTAPVMVAARLTPDALARVKASLKDANLPEDMELHGIVSLYDKTYNGIACKVAEVDCKKLRAKLEKQLEEAYSKISVAPETRERLQKSLERLDDSKLYVAVGFVEDTLVGFVTTNPELQVRVAASPQDSVLSRPDFNMADAQLQYPSYGLGFADKAITEAMIKLDIASYKGYLAGVKEIMEVLGKEWKVQDTAPAMAALDSIKGNMLGFYEKLVGNAAPVSCYAWQDQGVHVEVAMYPTGCFQLDAATPMNSVRPGPDTVLYYSGTVNPQIVDMYYSLIGDASRIVWDYGNAYIADPKNKVSDQIRIAAPMAQMARPTLEELWKAQKMAWGAMTGAGAYVVDMKGAPNPMLQNVPSPRFSLVYEVKDRAALGQAWQKVLDASRTIVPLVSQGKMTELPAPKSSTEGDVTTYDYECPMGPDLNPVVSVSDTRWALSMPKAFGTEVLKESMKTPGQVAPMEFQLNLVPVREALKGAAGGSKDIQKAVRTLDIITSDVTGIHATGRKGADGRDIYHLYLPAAGK